MKQGFALIILLVLTNAVFGQINMNEIKRFDDNYDTLFYHKGKSLTQLDSFDLKYEDPKNTLENLGREAIPMNGFNVGSNYFNALNKYNLNPNYFAPLPYFKFFYSIGSQAEQNMHLLFAQNVKKNFGYHFSYDRIVGKSFQRRNDTKLNRLNLGLYYKNQFYHGKLSAQFYDNKLLESGGIVSDSLLRINDLENIGVFKANAERRFKGLNTTLLNRFNFIKDSASTLRHGFYMRNILNVDYTSYSEEDSIYNLYPNAFYDSASTYDKYQYSGINNHIGYYLKHRIIRAEIGYGFDYYEVKNLGNDFQFRDHYFNSAIDFSKNKLSFTNHFDFYFNGRKSGDFNERFQARYQDSSWFVAATFNLKRARPTIKQNHYLSNGYGIWNNDFQQLNQIEASVKGGYQNHFMTIEGDASYQLTNKAIYWDSIAYKQISGSAGLLKIRLNTRFKFWKIINDLNITYRHTNSDIIRVPTLEINNRIYFKGRIFKSKKLLLITGLGVRYMTGYKGYGFTPEISEFYLSDRTVQNYPNLDFFLMLQINKVNFFFKIENWNNSFHKQTYYVAEGFPVKPTYFKLGLEWEFFN